MFYLKKSVCLTILTLTLATIGFGCDKSSQNNAPIQNTSKAISSELNQQIQQLIEKNQVLQEEINNLKTESLNNQTVTDTENTASTNSTSSQNIQTIVDDNQVVTIMSSTTSNIQSNFKDLKGVPNKTQMMIKDLAQLGVFGEIGNKFDPFQPVTRGEYITYLFNAYNAMRNEDNELRLVPHKQAYFSDVTSKHPAYPYIQALANAGYSVGYEDGTFKPNQHITREEMIAIKASLDNGGLINWGPKSLRSYSDWDLVDDRFVAAISTDYGKNTERAFGANLKTLRAKDTVLRFEAAASLWQTDKKGNFTATKTLEAQKQKIPQ